MLSDPLNPTVPCAIDCLAASRIFSRAKQPRYREVVRSDAAVQPVDAICGTNPCLVTFLPVRWVEPTRRAPRHVDMNDRACYVSLIIVRPKLAPNSTKAVSLGETISMSYLAMSDGKRGLFDAVNLAETGQELSQQYNSARPFPHIVIDNFLSSEVLDMCLTNFPIVKNKDDMAFDRAQERLKSSFQPDFMEPDTRFFFYSLNSKPFIKFLENITGINGLIPDPYFLGAGFHEIKNGGHLSMHADFNHHKVMNLERRINVLIYLNKDWKEEYGGQLELWDDGMTRCEQSVVPLFNRCVIFNTTSSSNHGNPNPVNHPSGMPRRSIALYYYTSTWSDEKRGHTTQFRTRANSEDKVDYQVKRNELVRDLLPPLIYRKLKALGRRRSGEP
jgi:hypothetical protein